MRNGSLDWECGRAMAENCEKILEKGLVPNLVWRAGRVEGVTRKVTLTATHSLLKAGGIPPQVKLKVDFVFHLSDRPCFDQLPSSFLCWLQI